MTKTYTVQYAGGDPYLSAFAVEYFERHGELPDEAVYAADQTQP